MKEFITGNHAVARAVRLCRTPLIAAYPITPQTPIYEKLSEWEASGELKGIMMRTESEHSAMAACIAASLTGVRTFTATSSQGLALMHEMLHFAAGCRVPVVMANVNRILSAPWGFWADQLDSLSQRDTGWIQFYCESGQEALDSVIQAYKISEQVFLPAMICLEAFLVSHFMEPVDIPDQDQVDHFLPPLDLPHRFDIDKPGYLVPVVPPELYRKYRHMAQTSMNTVKEIADRVDHEYRKEFGRGYGIIEQVLLDDAEIVIVTAGSITSTARVAIKALRQEGRRVGLLKIRLFRPFPVEPIQQALTGKKKIAVIDRNFSIGSGGIFCQELRAALVHSPDHPLIFSYIAGIGGTDVDPGVIEKIALDATEKTEPIDTPIWIMEDS
ncbi:MAG: transketolase C-terminal domain-containing protein [Thermodesulfobacteriota bacterium]